MNKCLLAVSLAVLSTTVVAQECFPGSISQTTPSSDFTVADDGTFTDTTTGLMWQTCSYGQNYADGDCTGLEKASDWEGALAQAGESTVAGYTDWRLPNVKELESLVEQSCINPAVNTAVIKGVLARDYWTSTPNLQAFDSVFGVEFYLGEMRSITKNPGDTDIYARFVRDAPR